MKQIMFGTLNDLIHYFLIYQLIYRVKQLPQVFNRDYVRITPLTIDATPLNYNSLFTDRTENNSLNSIFINQELLNRTINLTQHDIQTPTPFVFEEIVETMPTISVIAKYFYYCKIFTIGLSII